MKSTKNAKASVKTEPLPLQSDPISAFRGAGQRCYTSETLLRDRIIERQEEFDQDENTRPTVAADICPALSKRQ
jgi:hypothetical protein